MKKSTKYLLLAALFLVGFLMIQYTNIYGDSTWAKAFFLIGAASFLLGGISLKRKE
ncbi:hypothetical protein SAMN06298216_0210 [Spirosomataceae bacterium TFI 002]|nr:hypothetical protein SAMN06298216_0210 [Spirosomataceae bacterium TFI 002]